MRLRVNGKSLGQEMGNMVTLFGNITKLSSNQMNVELTTPDHVKIAVTLPEPFDGPAEGGMEVHGTVKSRSTMTAESYVHFSPEDLSDFVAEDYNDFLLILKFKLGQDEALTKAFSTA